MSHKALIVRKAQFLPYTTEAFAKIGVANAIWLIGEVLIQRDECRADFEPNEKYIWQTRRFEESVALLDRLPEARRHRVFIRAFRFRPYHGEHLFEQLVTEHTDMLNEGFRNEWRRRLQRRRGLITVAKQLLPKLLVSH
jgi:hypothetical protein